MISFFIVGGQSLAMLRYVFSGAERQALEAGPMSRRTSDPIATLNLEDIRAGRSLSATPSVAKDAHDKKG